MRLHSFLLSTLLISLLLGCDEKPRMAASIEDAKECAIDKVNVGETKVSVPDVVASAVGIEPVPAVIAEVPPLLGPLAPPFLPYSSGGGSRARRPNERQLCSEIEGKVCQTGLRATCNPGKYVCEEGRAVCRPDIAAFETRG